ncbi:hypothetical protein [Paraburkholderia kururiensis]|uniref:hypothetical protein n=1 Tax=Paraburkholderia kururiensis TaxID=984307 RepID=UPI0039A4335A
MEIASLSGNLSPLSADGCFYLGSLTKKCRKKYRPVAGEKRAVALEEAGQLFQPIMDV